MFLQIFIKYCVLSNVTGIEDTVTKKTDLLAVKCLQTSKGRDKWEGNKETRDATGV